jgi:hypothetical protein
MASLSSSMLFGPAARRRGSRAPPEFVRGGPCSSGPVRACGWPSVTATTRSRPTRRRAYRRSRPAGPRRAARGGRASRVATQIVGPVARLDDGRDRVLERPGRLCQEADLGLAVAALQLVDQFLHGPLLLPSVLVARARLRQREPCLAYAGSGERSALVEELAQLLADLAASRLLSPAAEPRERRPPPVGVGGCAGRRLWVRPGAGVGARVERLWSGWDRERCWPLR